MTRICGACETNPAELAFICEGCRATLQGQLTNLPALCGELRAALPRSSSGTAGGGGGGAPSPGCPINLAVSDVLAELDDVLARFLQLVPRSYRPVARLSVEGRSSIVSASLGEVVLRPESGPLTAELWWLHQRIRSVLDPAVERVSIGACGCGQALFAVPTDTSKRCRSCGTVRDVQERLDERSRAAEADFEDWALSPTQVSEATGGRITASRVTTWLHREKLERHGDPDAPVVRFGDALELERATLERRERGRQRRAAKGAA